VDRFEYRAVVWAIDDDGGQMLVRLNQVGAEGWEAVGVTARAMSVPMAGMGAKAVPEVIVLLKRRLGS